MICHWTRPHRPWIECNKTNIYFTFNSFVILGVRFIQIALTLYWSSTKQEFNQINKKLLRCCYYLKFFLNRAIARPFFLYFCPFITCSLSNFPMTGFEPPPLPPKKSYLTQLTIRFLFKTVINGFDPDKFRRVNNKNNASFDSDIRIERRWHCWSNQCDQIG